MLDNIPHIKAYWVMMTPEVAQIALRFGATISTARWSRRRFTTTPERGTQSLRRGELLRLIRLAGRTPVERDTLYRPVQRTETAFTVLV